MPGRVGIVIGGRLRSVVVSHVDRRTFLIGSATVGLAAACGGGDSEPDGGGSAVGDLDTRSGQVEFLVPTFPDGLRAASTLVAAVPQRISFVVRDDIDVLRDEAPDSIDLTISLGSSEIIGGSWPVHRDGIITPYYPITFTPPEPGRYEASIAGADPVEFLVLERSAVAIVQIGDAMRSVATPTFDDARGVDPICTRAVPCPFHEISLDDGLATGRPTVLLVATPGFCQTDICGPVVDLLIDAVADRDDITVVHGEVYVDPSEFASGGFPDTTPVVNTYSLPFEPQLVVADATGTIVGRLDTVWDRAELAQALATIG